MRVSDGVRGPRAGLDCERGCDEQRDHPPASGTEATAASPHPLMLRAGRAWPRVPIMVDRNTPRTPSPPTQRSHCHCPTLDSHAVSTARQWNWDTKSSDRHARGSPATAAAPPGPDSDVAGGTEDLADDRVQNRVQPGACAGDQLGCLLLADLRQRPQGGFQVPDGPSRGERVRFVDQVPIRAYRRQKGRSAPSPGCQDRPRRLRWDLGHVRQMLGPGDDGVEDHCGSVDDGEFVVARGQSSPLL